MINEPLQFIFLYIRRMEKVINYLPIPNFYFHFGNNKNIAKRTANKKIFAY